MKNKIFKNIFSKIALAAAFLMPLIIFPFIINPLNNSKKIVFFLTAFIAAFGFILNGFKKKKWELLISPISITAIVFAAFILLSSLISHQYPSEQFLGMGGIYLSFSAIILFLPSLIKKDISKELISTLNITASILAIISVFQLFGLGLPQLINKFTILNYPNNLSFSLTGSTFIAIQFLSIVLLTNIFDKDSEKDWQRIVFLAFLGIALGINVWAVIPGNVAAFKALSLNSSFSIARESLSLTRTALFGFGPSSYDNAYNILKPIWVNGQDYWQFIFDSAFNLPLTLVVTGGILSLLSWLTMLVVSIKGISKKNQNATALKAMIISIFAWQFFAPVNMITLFLLAISLAVFIAANENQYKTLNLEIDQILKPFRWGERKQVKNIIVTVISLILFFALTTLVYGFSKASFSYRKMYQSNKAASEDMIPEAYEYQKQAKNLTPHLDSVRRTYALINLEIAIALSNKTDLNPAEQDQILQLVNQAIREAKAATLLDPQNYQNWLSLAEIYLQLIDTTTQAQQEAFNALAQAINYNPNNPDLRMKLGQLFFSLKDYPNAVTFFGQAIERKPDLARAYYALAKSYQANKQYEDAQAALTSTLSLLNPDSADYVKVETELEDIANQIKASETANSDEIVQLEEENNESSASSQLNIAEEQSNLSGLLGQEDTEQIIQDEALVGEGQTIGN